MKLQKKFLPLVLALTLSQGISTTCLALDNSAIAPQQGPDGSYVDTWANNITTNQSPNGNPAIGTLSGMLAIWTPGTSWNNGTVLNQAVHNYNINQCIYITNHRSTNDAYQAYLDDRRNQSYSMIDGLGKWTDLFKSLSSAKTDIPAVIPGDATTVQYVDNSADGIGNDFGLISSPLGSIVQLVGQVRFQTNSSGNPSKLYYKYPRPWRWSTDVSVVPTLVPEESSNPGNDGGFPSGHTNAAFMAGLSLAYAVPERYQEILTRASELGYDRIAAGMHSPLDVMGGRMLGTAITTAAFNISTNKPIMLSAYNQAHTVLLTSANAASAVAIDRFSDYATNKKNYIQRLTYGFSPIGDTTKPMVVPKGAEVLLETRQPYLNATQRRWVLYTTGLQSGYPLLDDPEGYGRLNLFAAADGYGAFPQDVTVSMDATQGGFNAVDQWRNDISGVGKLTKQGTGTLKLGGNNTYTGGTEIDGGDLEGDSATAFGTGSVAVSGGTLTKNVAGAMALSGKYTQSANSTLELNISSKADVLQIKSMAVFGSGTLKLNFTNNYMPANGSTIITCNMRPANSVFSNVVATGLPSGYTVRPVYVGNTVQIQVVRQ